MKILRLTVMCIVALTGTFAWGHGFPLTLNVNGQGSPVSISVGSQQPVLDQDGTAPPVGSPMNSNLFTDQFLNTGTDVRGNFQITDEGGPNFDYINGNQAAWLAANPTITFSLTSPLYYSDGTNGGVAVPASGSTDVYFSDAADPNPNGSTLHTELSGGSLTPVAGFQMVSPLTFGDGSVPGEEAGHEMIKQLYIDPTSKQTSGEYGFAFEITAHFAGGLTLSSGPLVDVFALYSNGDDSEASFLASDPLQDAATIAIYNAATAVPEPSAGLLAMLAASLAGLNCWRKRRRAALG